MKRLMDSTVFKFLLVGVLNTLTGCGIMFLLYNCFGCSYWFSSAVNYVTGGTLSFFLNKNFTFQCGERSWKPAARFFINVALCYLIAYGAARPAVRSIFSERDVKFQENAAMLSGMFLYTALNYFGQRFFVFWNHK